MDFDVAEPAFATRRNETSDKDELFLSGAALRTWRYFAEFSTAEHNWLIPDNVQEEPRGGRGSDFPYQPGLPSERPPGGLRVWISDRSRICRADACGRWPPWRSFRDLTATCSTGMTRALSNRLGPVSFLRWTAATWWRRSGLCSRVVWIFCIVRLLEAQLANGLADHLRILVERACLLPRSASEYFRRR